MANCGVSIGQQSKISALLVVPQLIICQQWSPVGPPRIYRSYSSQLTPDNGPKKLFSIGSTVFENCKASVGSLVTCQSTISQWFQHFTNDGATICATWVACVLAFQSLMIATTGVVTP